LNLPPTTKVKTMKTLLVVAALCLLILSAKGANSDSKKFQQYTDLIGLYTTYLPEIAQSRDQAWAIVDVTPDPYSGYATSGGVAQVSGFFTVCYSFGATLRRSAGSYSWTIPDVMAFSAQPANNSMVDYYMSQLFCNNANFSGSPPHRRLIICLLNPDSKGSGIFSHAHTVPIGMEVDLISAITYLRANPQVLSEFGGNTSNDLQHSLLSSANPYLAAMGTQLLAATGNLTTKDVSTVFSSENPIEISACIAICRIYDWWKNPANATWLLAYIGNTRSISNLESTVVGLDAGGNDIGLFGGTINDLPSPEKIDDAVDASDTMPFYLAVQNQFNYLNPTNPVNADSLGPFQICTTPLK